MSDRWSSDWYLAYKGALIRTRGMGAPDDQGAPGPLMRPLDSIATLAMLAPVIARAVESQQLGVLGAAATAYTDSQGQPVGGSFDGGSFAGDRVTILAFLGYLGVGDGLVRARVSVAGVPVAASLYRPVFPQGPNADPVYQGEARALVRGWESCVLASLPMLRGELTDSYATPEAARAFLSGLRRITVALDVIGEAPKLAPVGAALEHAYRHTVDTVKEGITDASREAGEIAAEVANVAGDVAGNLGSGFLSGLGIEGAAVAGLAIYLAVA